MLSVRQKCKLLGLALGIFICYTLFGILQEKIFKENFTNSKNDENESGEKFTFPVAFVGVQCVIYSLVAKGE